MCEHVLCIVCICLCMYIFQFEYVQWNLSIADTLGLNIFCHFSCNIEVFLFLEVINVLMIRTC